MIKGRELNKTEEQQDLRWSELDKSHSLHKHINAHVVIIPSLWDYCPPPPSPSPSPRTPPSPQTLEEAKQGGSAVTQG